MKSTLEGVVRKIEIVFRHDGKRADDGQPVAVFAGKWKIASYQPFNQ